MEFSIDDAIEHYKGLIEDANKMSMENIEDFANFVEFKSRCMKIMGWLEELKNSKEIRKRLFALKKHSMTVARLEKMLDKLSEIGEINDDTKVYFQDIKEVDSYANVVERLHCKISDGGEKLTIFLEME